jgi:hypothetical protein
VEATTMAKRKCTIGLGDLVVRAQAEAERLMQDPAVASMVAAWVVQRVLASSGNRRAVAELAAMSRAG